MTLMTKKNKLIQEEINRVKTIMGLTEQMSVDGCRDYLEDLNYVVDSPSEEVSKTEKCEKKNIIKCVVSVLKANNVDENQIITQPFTPEGKCYTRVNNTKARGRLKSGNLTFWDNGVLTYIGIFKGWQTVPDNITNAGPIKVGKFQFEGRYRCEPSSGKITYSFFKLAGLRDDKNKVTDAYEFEPVDSSGVGVGYKVSEFFSSDGVGESGDVMDIVNLLT